jgi:hypothetical protein
MTNFEKIKCGGLTLKSLISDPNKGKILNECDELPWGVILT